MKVKLNNVRLAFPNLFKPEQINGEGDPKYGATFILPKGHPALVEINKAMEQVAKDKWADKAPAIMKKIEMENKLCLKNGDLKAEYDGFTGNYYISASNKVRPFIVDRDKTQLNPDDGVIYAGCYVNAVIDIWAMDNKFGKRICATLSGAQFFKDGDAFTGGAPATEDDFEDYSVTSEDGFTID